MGKVTWKAGTFEYPIPAAMVSCGTMEKSNIITVINKCDLLDNTEHFDNNSILISAKNNPDSTYTINAELLQSLYQAYNQINCVTLKSLMSSELPYVIDSPIGKLLMLHFIQNRKHFI